MTTKATLYLDPEVYRALKVKAAMSDQTVSETANALISKGLIETGVAQTEPSAPVRIVLEGKMGFPVLTLPNWPENHVFDREEFYD